MKTIFIHFLATAVLLLVAVSMNAEVYSGDCGTDGDNVKWTLETETGILSITGSGKMKSYQSSYLSSAPWFSYRESIKKVIMESGVTNIGGYAFYLCSSLTSINIPEGVTNIGEYAFYQCSSLTSINIPEGVTSIGVYVFSRCSGLTSITIPESVKTIENFAFQYCSSLTSINIPEGVTSIGRYTFGDCSGLISIIIPEPNLHQHP